MACVYVHVCIICILDCVLPHYTRNTAIFKLLLLMAMAICTNDIKCVFCLMDIMRIVQII